MVPVGDRRMKTPKGKPGGIEELREQYREANRRDWRPEPIRTVRNSDGTVSQYFRLPDTECSRCNTPYVRAHGHPTQTLCYPCWNPDE